MENKLIFHMFVLTFLYGFVGQAFAQKTVASLFKAVSEIDRPLEVEHLFVAGRASRDDLDEAILADLRSYFRFYRKNLYQNIFWTGPKTPLLSSYSPFEFRFYKENLEYSQERDRNAQVVIISTALELGVEQSFRILVQSEPFQGLKQQLLNLKRKAESGVLEFEDSDLLDFKWLGEVDKNYESLILRENATGSLMEVQGGLNWPEKSLIVPYDQLVTPIGKVVLDLYRLKDKDLVLTEEFGSELILSSRITRIMILGTRLGFHHIANEPTIFANLMYIFEFLNGQILKPGSLGQDSFLKFLNMAIDSFEQVEKGERR